MKNILISSKLLPTLLFDQNNVTTVLGGVDQFVSFIFGDIQLFDNMIFLSGATNLDSFLKAYKTKHREEGFPYKWFHGREKLSNKELRPYQSFFSILLKKNPLDENYSEVKNDVKSGLPTEQAMANLRMENVPAAGAESYVHLQTVWENDYIQSFADFLKLCITKNVAATLEAMQKNTESYHYKGIDILKFRCAVPNLANIILHKSTDSKFIPSSEEKIICLKQNEKICWWPSKVFTRKSLVVETSVRKSTSLCKFFLGNEASQIYPYLMCPSMETRFLY